MEPVPTTMNEPVAPPTVSVCIANFNGESLIRACLDSVLQQVDAPGIEILIHDDASTDDSVRIIGEYYPEATLIQSPVNVGFCVANNRMAEVARGEYLLLLNNDATLLPDALVTLYEAARKTKQGTIFSLPQYDHESGRLVDLGCLLDPLHTPTPNLKPDRRQIAYVIGACLWIPASAWRQLGGFPTWMESIAEDMYLCCTARLRGMDVRVVPRSGYLHRQGASFGGNRLSDSHVETTYRRRYLSERNRLWVVAACIPGPVVWPWLAVHALLTLAEGVLVSILALDAKVLTRIYFRAIGDAMFGLGPALRVRKQLQAIRQIELQNYLSAFTPIPRKLAILLSHGIPRFR